MNISGDTKVNLNNTNTDVQYDSQSQVKDENNDSESFKSFLAQNNINLSNVDQNLLYNILSVYEMPYSQTYSLGLAQNLQNISSSFNYDTLTIGRDDALFFNEMFEIKEINFTPETTKPFISTLNESGEISKTHEVSKTLLNLIENSFQTQKPVRIDFDNNISVILRIDKSGKLTAEFLPSDAAAEQYLRNNISYLRQNLDSQNIDYNDIYYRQYKENQKRQQNKQGDDNE